MIYQAKNYDFLFNAPGLSRELLKNHFTLYQGYVKQTNLLLEMLKKTAGEETAAVPGPGYAELKRRFGWEFNGMRLHEYYFENMTKDPGEELEIPELKEQIIQDFGSLEAWEKDFKLTGAMRGIGWAVLVFDPLTEQLFNLWINEHDLGHCAGLAILLVMDVFEHAYMPDYGTKKEDYMTAFFKIIHWREVERRFQTVTQTAGI